MTIGFSPCPNDTFIFDALVHRRIDTAGFSFEPVLKDVEELNRMAFEGKLDVTKLSYHAYAFVADRYVMLNAGSALGNNCGPLLIAARDIPRGEIPKLRVAIPGKYTTAAFLLHFFEPRCANLEEMLFSEIEDAVLAGRVDAGVIIHENRFTYAARGLHKLVDLGQHWESQTGFPIPLGGIAARRDLGADTLRQFERLLAQSVNYAFDHPAASADYVRAHAQETDPEVVQSHIDLYVNEYTRDLGPTGRAAIGHMLAVGCKQERFPAVDQPFLLPA